MTDSFNGRLETLVQQAKDKCRITWSDDHTNRVIEDDIVPSALSVIRFKIGIPAERSFDFTENGIEHILFVNYCYYRWHDAEDEFDKNYAHEIAQARQKWEVLLYAEQKETS